MRSQELSKVHCPKKATIYPKTHRSGKVTWYVTLGKNFDKKKAYRLFKTKEEAENYASDWNLALSGEGKLTLDNLGEISKHEILAAVEKLKIYNASIPEAVDFFLKYARPPKGQISTKEALDEFLLAKHELGRSPKYLESCKKTFIGPFAVHFADRHVNDITSYEAEKYLNSHATWNTVSKNSHITYLRIFYNWLIKRGYCTQSPLSKLERPTTKERRKTPLNVETTRNLLQNALTEGLKEECAIMVLVLFCGIRVNEAGRLDWANIDLNTNEVKLDGPESKSGRHRTNGIPANAQYWLKLCQSTGKIASSGYGQRLKRFRKRLGIQYPQNAMRHSFASYHLAKHQDSAKTAHLLGHTNPSLLYNTYKAVVSKKDAEAYWKILPESEIERSDNEAREQAENRSNIGQAIKDETGEWIPLHDPSGTQIEGAEYPDPWDLDHA